MNGEAVVTYVGSCPPIRPGPGNVVTGKYIHQSADNLIDLSIEGENQPTGVTTNHPYWSVDRQCFLQAGDLKRGEHVETRYGPRQVVSLTPRGNQPVYNLEVHGEHVYRVGTLGTLVHNKAMKVSGFDDFNKVPPVIPTPGTSITDDAFNSMIRARSSGITRAEKFQRAGRNLKEQLTLAEARSGGGTGDRRRIIEFLNDPKYYGFEKWEYVHRNPDGSNITIHYVRDQIKDVLFDFKIVFP